MDVQRQGEMEALASQAACIRSCNFDEMVWPPFSPDIALYNDCSMGHVAEFLSVR